MIHRGTIAMNKTALLVLLFCIGTTAALAQTAGKASLTYSASAIQIEYRPVAVPVTPVTIEGRKFAAFENWFDETQPGKRSLPSETMIIAIPPGSKPRLAVSGARYATVSNLPLMPNPSIQPVGDTALEYRYSSVATGPVLQRPEAEITGYGWVRNYYCAYIEVGKYRYNESVSRLEEMLSVSLRLEFSGGLPMQKAGTALPPDPLAGGLVINAKDAAGWQARQPLPESIAQANDWIDYNATYIKIAVGNDGIYRIKGSDLEAMGISAGSIVPSTLKVYESGKELAVTVNASTGTFGANDYVEFFAHKNYSGQDYRRVTGMDEEYLNYMDRYSDTTIYWLTWGGSNGLRASAGITGGATADTIDYYRHMDHYETDTYYVFGDPDQGKQQESSWNYRYFSWFGLKPVTWSLNVPMTKIAWDKAPEFNARMIFKAQSTESPYVYPSHTVRGFFNDDVTPIDSIIIDPFQQALFDRPIPQAQLKEGVNKFTVQNVVRPSGGPNRVTFDWFEFEYPRRTDAINNKLAFTILASDSVRRYATIKLTGFSSRFVVVYKTRGYGLYKTFNNLNAIQTDSGYTVYFADSVAIGDGYFACIADSAKAPRFVYTRAPGKKNFRNLHAASNKADYLLITNPRFMNAATEYAQFIGAQFGITAQALAVYDVVDEFSNGYFKPEGIRDFLRYALAEWQQPQPEYVFFVGDALYDYKNAIKQTYPDLVKLERNQNLLPSFGLPVADAYLVMWESTRMALPQYLYGRLPAVHESDVYEYLDRHKAYYTNGNSEWNKRYIMFSGGETTKPSELNDLFKANDSIKTSIIERLPVKGHADHFYKTITPPTSYGPYSDAYIGNSIAQGGVFISYLGHSGTQTWDNGISQSSQLRNDVDRAPIVTDFGCSTAKYAENDVVSFSELFTLGDESHAIAYVGNSSLGFISVTQTLSYLFYEAMLKDTVHTLGMAHLIAKSRLLMRYSTAQPNYVAVRTNTLIGDPIIDIAVPKKPNFVLREPEVVRLSANLTEDADSAYFVMYIRNHGSAVEQQLEVRLQHLNADTLLSDRVFAIPAPSFIDTVRFTLPVRGLKGQHKYTITLDPNNQITEIQENDNEVSGQFAVASASISLLDQITPAAVYKDSIPLMNPFYRPPYANDSTVYVEFDKSEAFGAPVLSQVTFGKVVTKIPIPGFIQNNSRGWFRYRLNASENWNGPFTFYRLPDNAKVAFVDSISLGNTSRNFSFRNGEVVVPPRNLSLHLASAGLNAGKFAVISLDGFNVVSGDQLKGYFVVVLDGVTKEVKHRVRHYVIAENTALSDTLTQFLRSLNDGDIALIAVADEPASGVKADLKTEMKNFGSTLFDAVKFQDSWCMIGVKGAAPGTANERLQPKATLQIAEIDTVLVSNVTTAQLDAKDIGPAGKWVNVKKSASNGTVSTTVYGVKVDYSLDTLYNAITAPVIDISSSSAETYPRLDLSTLVTRTSPAAAVKDFSMTVAYDRPAELALNYQTVVLSSERLCQGSPLKAASRVYNVGDLPASNIKVEYFLLTPSNEKRPLKSTVVPSIAPGASFSEEIAIPTDGYAGTASFIVEVDNDKSVREITRANNVYNADFYVIGDTVKPVMEVTFDGVLPMNGDYIRPNPDVVVKLFDESPLPIAGIANFKVYLNDTLVVNNPGYITSYTAGSGDLKGTVLFQPRLDDGTHYFRFNVLDASDNYAVTPDLEIMVIVESESQLMSFYNYPNPFSTETPFAFNLTGATVPEELRIKIYTVAGRLVRDLSAQDGTMRTGLNRIPWDGRDEDGDALANGTYLYKVSYTLNNQKKEFLGKLTILK